MYKLDFRFVGSKHPDMQGGLAKWSYKTEFELNIGVDSREEAEELDRALQTVFANGVQLGIRKASNVT